MKVIPIINVQFFPGDTVFIQYFDHGFIGCGIIRYDIVHKDNLPEGYKQWEPINLIQTGCLWWKKGTLERVTNEKNI